MALIAASDKLPGQVPPNDPPEWTSTPNPVFFAGQSATYELNNDTNDPEGDSLTYTLNGGSAALPTGVSLVGSQLVASSPVSEGTTTGIIIDVDDGTNPAVASSSFSIEVVSTISDQDLRNAGYLLVDDYSGVDPTGVADSIDGINAAMLDGVSTGKTVLFSAGGIYKVSDTVRCSMWELLTELRVIGMGGTGTSFARPKIVLQDSASGFNSGTERPVVCWRMFSQSGATFGDNPSNPLDEAGKYKGQANILFSSSWENIDIDCGNNSDAFGMYFPAAQRCYAGEVKITATNAKGGWWGLLGRNSPINNLEVVGGQWQIRNDARSGEGTAGCCIAGLKLTGDANTTDPIFQDDFVPLTIVGFELSRTTSGSFITTSNNSRTGHGVVTLIDGKITSAGGTVVNNANGKNFYARNVYITGTNNLVQSGSEATVTGSGTWKRINEYVFTDQTPTDISAAQYATKSLIDGTITPGSTDPEPSTSISSSVSAPTTDFIARHTISPDRVDKGNYINVLDEGAAPVQVFGTNDLYKNNLDNTSTDSRAAIQAAIDAAEIAGHNRVFLPRGSYYIGSPGINMKANTKLIGTGMISTTLATHGSWQPTSNSYVVTTADSASGTAHFSNIGFAIRTKDGTGGGTSTPYQYDWFSFILWRTGKNSSSIQPYVRREFQPPQNVTNEKHFYAFSGNAGGKHYGLTDSDGRRFGNVACRSIIITGTSQPLHIYGANMEITKDSADDALTNLEVTNSSNIRIYSCKREGGSGTSVITNSDNIALYGFGRQESDSRSFIHRIQSDCTNILIAPSTFDMPNEASTTKGNPEDNVNSVQINWPEGCSLFKIGTLNDSAVEI